MYKIYYTDDMDRDRSYKADKLEDALKIAEGLRRNEWNSFVIMVSENPDVVGKPGVDSVTDGKLPDGSNYTWMKRRNS